MGTIESILDALTFGGDGWTLLDMTANGVGTGTAQAYTHLNITGKGILTSLRTDYNGSAVSWTIQIDGGSVRRYHISRDSEISLFLPFHTSLVVTSGLAAGITHHANALVDNGEAKWSSYSLATSLPSGATHYANTALDVTGSGIVVAVLYDQASYNNYAVEADNSGVIRHVPTHLTAHPQGVLFYPFTTRMRITCDQNPVYAHLLYLLD